MYNIKRVIKIYSLKNDKKCQNKCIYLVCSQCETGSYFKVFSDKLRTRGNSMGGRKARKNMLKYQLEDKVRIRYGSVVT